VHLERVCGAEAFALDWHYWNCFPLISVPIQVVAHVRPLIALDNRPQVRRFLGSNTLRKTENSPWALESFCSVQPVQVSITMVTNGPFSIAYLLRLIQSLTDSVLVFRILFGGCVDSGT